MKNNIREIERAIMDAEAEIRRALAWIDKISEGHAPRRVRVGQADNFYCMLCDQPTAYGDNFCRFCGDRIRWDK